MENYLVVENINEKGYGIIPKLVMQDKNLSIESKAIYAYFCSYAGAGNQAFPSVSKIMLDLGIGKNRFYKHLNLLKDNCYITTEQHKNSNNKFTNTIYTLCSKIKSPCLQNRDTQIRDTQIGDTQNDTTNNNSIKNNSIKNNKNNNNNELVVVDSSILNLQSKIKDKTNLLIHEKSIIKLLESKTEDKIMYYADNWNKIVATSKGEVGGGLFIDAVMKEYSIPEKNATNVSQVDNMFNFEQRNYKKEDFEKYYYKVTE